MSKTATLLFAHGGGFCKETWEPIMRRLTESPLLQGAINAQFVTFDFKYHGSNRDESVEPQVDLSKSTSPRVHHPAADLTAWTSAQVLQEARALKSKSTDTPLIGIGHSMGASAMWNTEVNYPGTFDGLILFEPVYGSVNSDAVTTFLVSITLKRESSWPSRAAAEEHLRNFRNFAAWDREALEAYMKGALVEEPSGRTVLACSPSIEASLYCHKLMYFNDQQLGQPKCNVHFHSGGRTKMFLPSTFAEVNKKYPDIYTLEEPIPDCSHAMIMEKPAEVSEKILANLADLDLFRAASTLPICASHNSMDALLAKSVTLRCFLQRAAERNGDPSLGQKLVSETRPEVSFALDHTFLILPPKSTAETLPRAPWSCENCISHTELIHHVIERLLARKRVASNWEDVNILTLGYREVTPGVAGHRVTQSNGIMCYYPNTLVSTLKKPLWEALHQIMGDDLMVHLLLNYTIFVQVKDAQLSYIQLAGKSLRRGLEVDKSPRPETIKASVKREVSINHVMYARHFQKDRVFPSSHVLVKSSKASMTCELISRGEASRVLRAIFPGIANQKRLPKRMINLIPTVQSMVARFKACNIEELVLKMAPVPPDFRKFMADNPDIKSMFTKKKAEAEAACRPLILPIVRKALDDGYLSQTEDVAPSSDRKRKRREEAIDKRSNASSVPSSTTSDQSAPSRKKQRSTIGNNENDRDSVGLAKLQQHKEDIKKALAFVTPKKGIYRLVRKLVARVVPKDIWGNSDTKNWKVVKVLLRKLIFSRKFDIFSLKKCAKELQVTNVEWMNLHAKRAFRPPNERIKRHQLFEDLVWWVISSLVFPLLRNLFYVTEAEGMANEIAYYQRPVWNVIRREKFMLALDDMEGGILQASWDQRIPISQDRQLATSRLRLLPKATGIRPLMNLSTPVDQASVSVNRSLETVHRVLTFEIDRQPKKLLGSSVRNMDEIYKRLKPLFREIAFCPRCAERRQISRDQPSAYCVTVDIERCFDTIRPRKLYQVLKKALREDEYLIRKHWVGHQVSSIDANDALTLLSSFFFKLERPAYPSGDLLGFDELATQSKKKNAMFVDGVIYDYLTKAKALQLLKEHLLANVVQMDGHEFVQRCGIPQGSVLSTTLCNVYYAHFERRVLRKHLPEICNPSIVPPPCCQHEELLRYTDDFLYVTTDLKRAQRFLKVMHKGNQEYGCFVNRSKSQANFEATFDQREFQRVDSQESDGCLSWCGMLIDPIDLQIYVNYDKISGTLQQASIPLNESKAAQSFFVNKVVSPIRQRWHALYFDPEMLTEDTIHVNLFQMLSVAANRFLILIEMLPFVNQDMCFFHECIRQILRKMTKGIHRSLELSREAKAGFSGHQDRSSKSYEAQKHQVWTIGLYAFQLTIQAKHGQAKPVNTARDCPKVNWPKLLSAVQADRAEMKRKAGARQDASIQVERLSQDPRNATILTQCLQLIPPQ